MEKNDEDLNEGGSAGPRGDAHPEAAALTFGGGGSVAMVGALSGVAIALGGPAVVLGMGQSLGPVVLTTLVVIALSAGALVALTSAFFGLVIPSKLRSGPWMDPERWRRVAEERRRWHAERWQRRHGYPFAEGEPFAGPGPDRAPGPGAGRGPRRPAPAGPAAAAASAAPEASARRGRRP